MFTFSFGSAFAAVSWTGEATSKYLTEAADYDVDDQLTWQEAGNTAAKGTEGITEAARAWYIAETKAELDFVKKGDPDKSKEAPFYAPEKAEAVALIEACLESLKTVKTDKAAMKLISDLEAKVGKWDWEQKTLTANATSLKQKATVRTEAYDAIFNASDDIKNAKIDITRIMERAIADNSTDALYLPGYAEFNNKVKDGATNENDANVEKTGASPNFTYTLRVLKADNTSVPAAANFVDTLVNIFAKNDANYKEQAKAVIDWFMNNDYRTAAEIKSGVKAFASALVLKNDAYKKTVTDEFNAIRNEIYTYVDKSADARRGLPISDLEGVETLVKKIKEFKDKYDGLTGYDLSSAETQFKAAIATTDAGKYSLAANYFDQYYTEVAAVPAVKKLTDADKATVIALYKKVVALTDAYTTVWSYAGLKKLDQMTQFAYDFDKLVVPAYEHFLKADVKAFNDLDDFDTITKGSIENGVQKYYFDASEKNVGAVKAQRAAYDALVANYGYADLDDAAANGLVYRLAAQAEAAILAAEHNQGADAGYDVKDTKKLQAYLNNATLKVTTKALGNSKIRVNARFDAETYKDIVAECGNDYTISYKFYQKKAKATSFKGPKEKSRNYITYTKASLKKGTKYKFQCGVVIKDAQGNVVAEKNYRASTTGSRICR